MEQRPTLIFLHGHGVDPSIWDFLVPALDHDYAIQRPDLSRITEHTTIDAYAEAVHAMLSSSKIDQCILIGHSLGGYIALAFAKKHPELVRGLVLFHSTAFADADTDEQRKKRQDAQDMLEQQGAQPFVEKAVRAMFTPDHRDSMAGTYVDHNKTLPVDALLAGLQAIRSRQDQTPVLANATYPVLIIAGKQDEVLPISRSEELHKALPKADYVVLDNSAHLGMVEEPEASLRALQQFLEKAGGRE
ncbi:alpha/beta hydrolase [Fibrella sp. HMF5335]|uniref:Alpha/beta hydrolase n=1 Tax=Fibrella rubiginis TaxID=2817060 RepID=A0A939GF89_9BACT|nr:alpha/beta hydrolase [Fibrella rubiginis]MBO0936149.1 alpha/beta hydrolase [Fibrella rubiginis]